MACTFVMILIIFYHRQFLTCLSLIDSLFWHFKFYIVHKNVLISAFYAAKNFVYLIRISLSIPHNTIILQRGTPCLHFLLHKTYFKSMKFYSLFFFRYNVLNSINRMFVSLCIELFDFVLSEPCTISPALISRISYYSLKRRSFSFCLNFTDYFFVFRLFSFSSICHIRITHLLLYPSSWYLSISLGFDIF